MTLKPKILRPGGTIAVISPASYPMDDTNLEKGIEALEARSFCAKRFPADSSPVGFLSNTDEVRADAFNSAVSDPDVDAIICTRGGYGSMRILDRIDYACARTSRKLLVGYSDITALQMALYRNAGWTSLSGPMVAVDWPSLDSWSEGKFIRLAAGKLEETFHGPNGEPLSSIREGSADGILLGGNLATLVRLIGTPYLPDMTGAVLFLEDVGEAPYRIDAMLAQLRLSGILDSLGGVVLGDLSDCEPADGKPSLDLEKIFHDYFAHLSIPVAGNLAYGHVPVKHTIPIGTRVSLSVTGEEGVLRMIEPSLI
jgi:muramoyltetrapeptide carboxypeptidase